MERVAITHCGPTAVLGNCVWASHKRQRKQLGRKAINAWTCGALGEMLSPDPAQVQANCSSKTEISEEAGRKSLFTFSLQSQRSQNTRCRASGF